MHPKQRVSAGSPTMSSPKPIQLTAKSISENIVASNAALGPDTEEEQEKEKEPVKPPTPPPPHKKKIDSYNSTRAVLKTSVSASTSSFSEAFAAENQSKTLPTKPLESGQHLALRQRANYDILVLQSCFKFPDKMREVVTFVISIRDKEKDKEMWRIEKSYNDFCYLDEMVCYFL